MNHALNLQQVRELAARVVVENGPDFVYETPEEFEEEFVWSVYWRADGSPSCLVGVILSKVGVEPFPYDVYNQVGIDMLVEDGYLVLDKPTMAYLEAIQVMSDCRQSWGDSVAHAEELLREEFSEFIEGVEIQP